MLKIYLARHGQDSDNVRRVLNGRRDTSLTIVGREQALQLAKNIKLANLSFDKIYVSPLLRVRQTAKIITDYLSLPEAEILPDLVERDFGIMTGRSIDDIALLDKNNIIHTSEVDYFLNIDGAETFDQLIERGRAVLNKVKTENSDGNILLLTSGDIGKMIYTAYHNKTWEEVLPSFYFSNTELILLETGLFLEKSIIFKLSGIFNETFLGLSERSDGNMKGDYGNIKEFLKTRNLDKKSLFVADLDHGDNIILVYDLNQKIETKGDALISNHPDCLLALTSADCPIIYFYDPVKKVVALAHAGWRGVVKGIAEKVVISLKENYASNANDIQIFVGPHIKSCHFEIKEDVTDKFEKEDLIIKDGKMFVDLGDMILKRLLKQGIKKENINISPDCTYCLEDKYFSFRRNNNKNLETMLGYIALK